MIPRVAHFVFGLRPQTEPFHLLQYLAVRTCADQVQPDEIVMHVHNQPYGVYWDLLAPVVTIDRIGIVDELGAPTRSAWDYSYAHHADVLRLDILAAEGGLYSDIDVIFLRAFPDAMWRQPAVIGREADVTYDDVGVPEASVSNAVMLAEPGSRFITRWREQILGAMDGSWSGHSCRLAMRLATAHPDEVYVAPREAFHPYDHTTEGIARLLEQPYEEGDLSKSLAVHTCAHLWWHYDRQDFSRLSAFEVTEHYLSNADTPLAAVTRDHLPGIMPVGRDGPPRRPRIHYVSDQDVTGYGIAARRLVKALGDAGCEIRWTPFVWNQADPVLPADQTSHVGLDHLRDVDVAPDVLIVHATPEIADALRWLRPTGVPLVLHTVWEHDTLQAHWPALINTFDAVIVPTRWNAESFIKAGVEVPVIVLPHMYDDGRDGSDSEWLKTILRPAALTFHSVAVWRGRKAPENAISAYARAFEADDNVMFVLKTTAHAEWDAVSVTAPDPIKDQTWLRCAETLAKHAPNPPLHLVTRELTFAELAGLRHSSDVWLSLPRAEGWDLGCFDAAAAGLPVVTTAFGGPLDYLDPELSFLVPGQIEENPIVPGAVWLDPDIDAAAEALRRIRDDPASAREKAATLARQLRIQHAPDRVAEGLLGALADLALI